MDTIIFSGYTGAGQRETGTSRREMRSVQQKQSGTLGWQWWGIEFKLNWEEFQNNNITSYYTKS